jgi:hypothetical protein
MATSEPFITQLAVRELAAAGAVREAVVIADPDAPAWLMRIRTGALERTLRMRDAVRARRFQSVDAAVALARKFELRTLVVDLGAAPARTPKRR